MNALYVAIASLLLVELQLVVVFSSSNPHKYNLDRPKRIEGSKMWVYKRELAVRQVKEPRKKCCNNENNGTLGSDGCETLKVPRKKKWVKMLVRQENPIYYNTLSSHYDKIEHPRDSNGHYPRNIECVWLFKATGKRRIKLTIEITDFHLAGDPAECHDYVQILFVSRRGNLCNARKKQKIVRKKLCANTLTTPYTITRTAHLVEVTFVTDSTEQSRGFSGRFYGLPSTMDGPLTNVRQGGSLFGDRIPVCGYILLCLPPNSRRTESLCMDVTYWQLANLGNQEEASKHYMKVSEIVVVNKTHFFTRANASRLKEALKLYEESNGECRTNDAFLKRILAEEKTITWPENFWDENPSPTKKVIETTVSSVGTRTSKLSGETSISPPARSETVSPVDINKSSAGTLPSPRTKTAKFFIGTEKSKDNMTSIPRH